MKSSSRFADTSNNVTGRTKNAIAESGIAVADQLPTQEAPERNQHFREREIMSNTYDMGSARSNQDSQADPAFL